MFKKGWIVAATTDHRLDGLDIIADYLGIGKTTLKRWRRLPEGGFIQVGSSGDCEYGQAAWSYETSLDNLHRVMEARTSDARRIAVAKRRDRQ